MLSRFEYKSPILRCCALRKSWGFWLLAAGILLAGTGRLGAATYYVRTDGNDFNTGTGPTAANAWATVVGAAVKSLAPGDVIYVRTGTYVGEIQPSNDGTSASPIQFIADVDGAIFGTPGDVVLQASAGVHVLDIQTDDYLQFVGFKLQGDNSSSDTVEVNASGFLLEKCEIYVGGGAGVDVNGGSVTLNNCLIRNNASDGIHVDGGSVTIQNCTIVNNGGDGVDVGSSSGSVYNTILFANGGYGLSRQADADGTLTHFYNQLYSNTNGNYGGTTAGFGELTSDPLFVSAADYHLRETSPAKDTGVSLAGTVDDDFHGNPRPFNTNYDMGYHEFGATSGSTPLLFVTQNDGYFTTQERVRKTILEAWGYGVTAIADSDTQANYDTALASAIVVYVPEEVQSTDVSYKLRETTLGVLFDEDALTDEFGLSTSASDPGDHTTLTITDNSHYITSPFSTGALSYASPAADAKSFSGTLAPGMQLLGDWTSSSALGVVETGGSLANTHNSSSTAFGRRVGFMHGSGYDWSDLTDDGRTLVKRALEWASVGLVGHWKLDETSGTTAADSSPVGYDGTYTNSPALGNEGAYPGDVLNSVEFDGTDDYVDLPDMDVNFSNGFSIALWVKPTASPGAGQGYAFFDLSNGQDADEIWLGWFNTVGFQLYMTDTDDGSTLKTIEDNTDFEVGKWVHCVVTVDAAGNATLYRNGEVTKSGFYTSIPTNVLRTQNALGTSTWNDNFPGNLDDVRLYNRPLSAVEVASLYGLMGHWKMDEGAGVTASDSTGFANDATLNGATWTTDCAGNNGLAFDGISDTATTNVLFDPPERGTVAYWIRSAGPPTSRQRPWGVGSDYEMWQDTDGLISFDVSTDGFQGGFITDEPLDMSDRWYHLIAEYDSDDDSYAIYINGELHKSGISTWAMTKQAANTLTFGTRTGNTEYFEGAMRDFRVYNRPLSGSEIGELSGLMAYWKLDESSGTIAVDSSTNGNDGTYTNGVLLNQTGNILQAAEFDGSDDYVGVPDDPTLQMDATFSLSAWIRADSSANVNQMILNKEGEYEIAVFPGGVLYWGIKNTDPGWSWHSTGHIVAYGKWTHVAMTYDNGTVSTYANGRLVDTYNGSGTVGDQYTSLNELRLGGRSNNPTGKYFDGRLDDIRLFNRVLCPEEVFGQYKGGRPAGIRIIKWVEVR